ncbi:invasion protein [Afipia sp. P52-10]|uniref:invasion associated locus B family protein n=1 Tax=Afipia sp. P52-10 TaxID=1429916 RepID=UPI0003DEF6F8|nr:invasion associated locus B family protein [Afipia sp. P52-10]ETR76957.1 invasion protein [Afipia sp. P52-10]
MSFRSFFAIVLLALYGTLAWTPSASAQAPRPAEQPAAPARTPAASSLPGAATSLQETHGDWVVSCALQGASKRCGLTQEHTNQQTRQRVFAVELTPVGDKVEGVLLLPFGLVLDQGVALQVDDQAEGQPLRFRTCLMAGCLVQVTFDARQAAALRGGTALKMRVTPEGGPSTVLAISLKGLGAALDRTIALAR